jgi:murein DD-endopeptidase MepM/ murein hydrolase activator NlpD
VTIPSTPAASETTTKTLTPPLSDALSRVTKKPFGIKISPATSPVQPEKFSGYHTGVDFEILPGEEDKDVPVYAVCVGTVVYKNYVSGYGGVFIEQCKIDGQDVTVLYGHLKLASITNKLNDNIKAGDQIAILGKGYSSETDGERKHLHLGIHKGTAINFKGYVQAQSELSGWLDAMKYLNP